MTIDTTRRGFLGGLMAVAAMTALPFAIKLTDIPLLVGDGKHDDWAALQAWIDGKPFKTADGFVGIIEKGELNGGTFLLSKPIDLTNSSRLAIRNCYFTANIDSDGWVTDQCIFEYGKTRHA